MGKVGGGRSGISSLFVRATEATAVQNPLPLNLSGAPSLDDVRRLDAHLSARFADQLVVDHGLSRSLVSFQANKAEPVYRWYKFKEGFSAALVKYFLGGEGLRFQNVLDPFAGSGTTLFAAAALGMDADGIELLPIGASVIRARQALMLNTPAALAVLDRWLVSEPWRKGAPKGRLQVLRITEGAYPPETHAEIETYLGAVNEESQEFRDILVFVLLCVLESVSLTRKDGQYLRWDSRAGKGAGRRAFSKGEIPSFGSAISQKLRQIVSDSRFIQQQISIFKDSPEPGSVRIFEGSCLSMLPRLADRSYDTIFTSPPYCNRYDYTRTYALELAALGCDELQVAQLRQDMLSCTVENRAKDLISMNSEWSKPLEAVRGTPLLGAILEYLEEERRAGRLNNNGIPRMVSGYFQEMACVLWEAGRVLKSRGILHMVNDNVRYAGAPISVDLILCSIAEELGFATERIIVLPTMKGNSSQQMGRHGRDALRKCIYVLRKN